MVVAPRSQNRYAVLENAQNEPMPLPGKLSRDPDDNVFVATAAAVQAAFLVTQDRDLIALAKPFGVRIVTPVELIRELRL